MGKRMFMRDKRLKGNPPAISGDDNLYEVDATVTLANAFLWVKNYATASNGLDVLYIMCHGFYAWEENQQLQASIMVGGYGLQLCKEGLTLGTMDAATDQIKEKIKAIVLFACGSSSTQSNKAGTKQPGDGKYFCQQLCKKSKAEVYGADREQWYFGNTGIPGKGIDFGQWEGTVYRYSPPDGKRTAMETNASPSPT